MEERLNVVKKISDRLYVITETESVHCYLVLGSTKAMIVDLGYGYEDIQPMIREITDLPVMAVVSHGDPDHGLGSSWFDDVWIHPLDWGKLLMNDTEDIRRKAMEYRMNKLPFTRKLISEDFVNYRITTKTKPHFLCSGDKISLGDLNFEVLHTPGHSYGHIMLIERNRKWVFSGDQLTAHNIWHFVGSDQQAPFASTLASMRRLRKTVTEDYKIYPAHDIIPIDSSYLDDLIDCLEWELAENYKQDTEFHSFMGDGWQHLYKTVNLIYSDERLEEWMGKKAER